MFNVSYRKVGGLRFVRIGRLGFSFFVSRPRRVEPVAFDGTEWTFVAYDR